MEEKAHVEIGDRREGSGGVGVGEEFKGEGGGVVGHAEEVRVRVGEVGEAEEGEEGVVGAELGLELELAGGGDGGVETDEDLAREDLPCDGAHGVGVVVGEIELVRVGEGAELEEVGGRESVAGIEGGVVDGGDVEQVEDGVGVFEGGLRVGESAVVERLERLVEAARARQ